MNYLLAVLVILMAPLSIFSSEVEWIDQFVSIYKHADEKSFGHTTNRSEVIKEDVFNFMKGRTLKVNGELGYLTAVTLSRKLKEELDALLENNNFIDIKGRSLRLVQEEKRQFYVYRESERSIFIGFALESASAELIELISQVYQNEPIIKELVTNYYKQNYVIRIYQADSFYSRELIPSLMDIMLNATLLGDEEQLLLGVHDGQNFLGKLKEFYQKKIGYSILIDHYNDTLEP